MLTMSKDAIARLNAHSIRCDNCDATELHPETGMLLIRAYKADNYSQCLVCSGYYDAALNETPHNHNPEKGWFR